MQSERRGQLRQLDECLRVLEDAHDRNEAVVSAELSKELETCAPMITQGMRIADAIDLVFERQSQYLPARTGTSCSAVRLDQTAARALTERIKKTARAVSLLLLEAHERQAWLALGYHSWEQYVRHEFELSRPRSYELLDHGRLLRLVHEVTGVSGMVSIAPYKARRLKPHLAQFVPALRSRASSVPTEEMPAIVSEVIEAYLPHGPQTIPTPPPRRPPNAGPPDDDGSSWRLPPHAARLSESAIDIAALRGVIEYLAAMPPAPEVIDHISMAAEYLGDLDRALRWLDDLASEWRAHQSAR